MEIPHLKDKGLLKPKGLQSFHLALFVTARLESELSSHRVGDWRSFFQREVQSSVHSGDIGSVPTDKPMCSSLEGLK